MEKSWIDKYLELVEPYGGAPEIHLFSALSALSAVLQRKVWVDRGLIGKLYAAIYVVIVAPPGIVKKTTTTSIVVDLLKKLNKIDPVVTFAADVTTPAALIKDMSTATKIFEHKNSQIVQSPVFAYCGELATLFDDIGGGEIFKVLLRLYDCPDTFDKSIIKTGKGSIQAPYLTILGCTQPDYINTEMPRSTVRTGMASRIIYVCRQKPVKTLAEPKKMTPSQQKIQACLVDELYELSQITGPVTRSKAASKWFDKWYQIHEEKLASYTSFLANYMARKADHVEKLGMIFALSRIGNTQIEKEDLERALKVLNENEPKMLEVLGTRTIFRDESVAQEILNAMSSGETMTLNDILGKLFMGGLTIPANRDLEQVLMSLQKAGAIECENKNGRVRYRKK